MPKPEPKLHKPPPREALAAQQEAAERLLRLDGWTEAAAVQVAPEVKTIADAFTKAARRKKPIPPTGAEEARAKLQAALYAIPIEAEHSLFVRIPQRLFKMLEEVKHDRRHASIKELVLVELTRLAEEHTGIRLHKDAPTPD